MMWLLSASGEAENKRRDVTPVTDASGLARRDEFPKRPGIRAPTKEFPLPAIRKLTVWGE